MKKFKRFVLVAAGISFVWGPTAAAETNRHAGLQLRRQRMEQRLERQERFTQVRNSNVSTPASPPQRGWRAINFNPSNVNSTS